MATEHNTHAAGAGHEKSDANVRSLAAFAAGLVLLMLIGMFAMRLMYVQMKESTVTHDPPLSPLAAGLPQDPPDPRLQVIPAAELKAYREEQDEKLSSYGWVEPNAGVLRIPVERAMELLLERGLPVRAGGSQNAEAGGRKANGSEKVKRVK